MTQAAEIPERDSRFIPRMDAQDYIDKTREYLDYVEEHIENVRLSFIELVDKCSSISVSYTHLTLPTIYSV